MTTLIKYSNFGGTTAALFRTWGKTISDAFRDLGWVQASDTGQINWSTVTLPTGIGNTSWNLPQPFSTALGGYEIWRMNDALQATAPIFLKIEYGTGWANTACPGFRFTLGTGSDGAGNLLNPSYKVWTGLPSSSREEALRPWLFSGGPGRFQMIPCWDKIEGNTWMSPHLTIERESTGPDTPGDKAAYLLFTDRGWYTRVESQYYLIPTPTVPLTTPQIWDPGSDCTILYYSRQGGKTRIVRPRNLWNDGLATYPPEPNVIPLQPLVATGIDGPIIPSGNLMIAPMADIAPLNPIKVKWGTKDMTMMPLWILNTTGVPYVEQAVAPDCLTNGGRRFGLLMRWE